VPGDQEMCIERADASAPRSSNTFNPGSDNQLMMVRACMIIDRLLPFSGFGLNLTRDDSGGLHMMASSVFVNEPDEGTGAMIGYFRRFAREDRAAVAFETVLMTPILVWAFIGSFVFFDAYRIYNTSVKTSYMVADMLSRQTNMVYGHDIQGMANVANGIIRGSDEVEMRVTQIGMVSGNYKVDWSWRERRRAAVQFQHRRDPRPASDHAERRAHHPGGNPRRLRSALQCRPDRRALRQLHHRAAARRAGAVRSRRWPTS
jgi:hypothetical protein